MTTTSLFSITPLSNSVPLDHARRGSATFTVTNLSDRPIRARARASPMDGAEAAWFSIGRPIERTFDVDQTEQYIVRLHVDDRAPAGSYRFRLDMVSELNPDDEFTEGPALSFSVGAPTTTRASGGYPATMLGTLIGVLAGAAAGLLIGALIGTLVAIIGGDLGSIITGFALLLLFSLPGPWIGAVVATWLLLRTRGHPHSKATAAILAVVFPLWVVAFVVVLNILDATGLGGVLVFLLLGVPSAVLVPATVARATALRWPGAAARANAVPANRSR